MTYFDFKRDFFSLKVKDDCPNPTIFEGRKPYSIVIEIVESHYVTSYIDVSGYLDVLREQYPEGLVILTRYAAAGKYIEIGFGDESMRHAALSKPPMKIRDQLVHAIKSTYLGDRLVYRLKIKNIDSLGRPYEYRKWILDHLQKFGTVEDLHLHYTEGGNWFLGEGCAIIVMSPDDKHHVLNHPILKISVEEYNVTR